jgi:magnesium transporter
VDAALKIALPTREEMAEIELSSRVYQEENAVYLTASILNRADTDRPESVPVTFVLAGHTLVTVRYAEPQPFRTFGMYILKHPATNATGDAALSGLLDTIIDRIADVLERVQKDVDTLSNEVFHHAAGKPDYQASLRRMGQSQMLISKARDSLVTLARILSFLSRPGEVKHNKTFSGSLKTLARDVVSLSDHATYLSNNIAFLLNATLGLINSDQNAIIKIFSVAAVVFLPPTLIASIYGMNFHFMPELDWPFGYPFALGLMVLSVVFSFFYFKRKGWL